MMRSRQTTRTQLCDTPWQAASRAAVVLLALWLPLAHPLLAAAQESGLQQLFDGVSRGTAMPEVFRNVLNSQSDDSDEDAQSQQAPATGQLQQPSRVQAGAQSPGDGSGVNWRTAGGDEPLPAPRLEGTVPIAGWNATGDVDISRRPNGNVSMVVRDASLSRVLSLLAQTYNLNVVASNDIDAIISITLHNVPMEQALTAILAVANYTWVQQNGIILVTSLTDAAQLPADIQGRQMQVFELDFASASEVADAVTQLLSPVGRIAVSESSDNDNRRTRETILVEDLPQSLDRVAAYIHQVDQAPRQVLLEAHILQVTLSDDMANGVNFDALFRTASGDINVLSIPNVSAAISALSDENPEIEVPTSLITISGTDLFAVIELLKKTTDAKTLGSPKLLVLDEQEARIQIGEKIAYATTTTTQTSANAGASFIETGTILRIRPRITRDNRVMLRVEPEVSEVRGQRPSPELPPDTSTTELETDVMLEDGQGMVIGGLIKESDTTNQSKIPYLGDVRGVGWLFRHTQVVKERQEIIVAIVPRIQPYDPRWQAYEQGEIARTGTPLFEGPLCRTERTWEPILPDGKRVAKPLIPPPHKKPYIDRTLDCVAPTPSYYVPRRPYPRQQFINDCNPDVPAFPRSLRNAEPEFADEFASEFSGDFSFEGAVISDQP